MSSIQEIPALEAEAARHAQAGRSDEAARLWGRILALDPDHIRALTLLGQFSFRKNDFAAARVAFQRVVDLDGRDPQQWINVALACQSLKDEAGEETAITGALKADPMDLLGLILRGNLYERQGKTHKAASAYGAAATVAPPRERLHPDLHASVAHASSYKAKYDADLGAYIDDYLVPRYRDFAGEKLNRFRDSVDIMLGRKRRFDSHSMMYHFPNLAPIEFFERADFPWLDAIEAATDAIRDEFLGTLATDKGFTPYITYPDDVPLNQWAELNNSPAWSAFHLIKNGVVIGENATKCPATMAALAHAPQPDQPGRTPSAMFSLLKPKTRIPPHTGVSNARLVTHLPLIVPPACGFRVGNDVREWAPGKAWVFDDTIEHEAWNDSDKLRVVLIFDIWHPQLSLAERALVTAMTRGINEFRGETGGFEL